MSCENPWSDQENNENQLTCEKEDTREERPNQDNDYQPESSFDQIDIIKQFNEEAIQTVTLSAGDKNLAQDTSCENLWSDQENDANELPWEREDNREERPNPDNDYQPESPFDQIDFIKRFYEEAIETVTLSAVDSVKATLEMGCYLSHTVVEPVISLDENFLELEEHLKNLEKELNKTDEIYDCYNVPLNESMW